jgi:hypothetical protein
VSGEPLSRTPEAVPRPEAVLSLRTRFGAPVAAVLRASLDLDVELAAVRRYGVRTRGGAAGSRAHGRIGIGETVTWRWGPAGVPLHTSRIVELVEDDGAGGARFVDAMERGLFAAFWHEHVLLPVPAGADPAADAGTLLHDLVRWRSPAGGLGRVADALAVRRALRALLLHRNAEIARAVGAAAPAGH